MLKRKKWEIESKSKCHSFQSSKTPKPVHSQLYLGFHFPISIGEAVFILSSGQPYPVFFTEANKLKSNKTLVPVSQSNGIMQSLCLFCIVVGHKIFSFEFHSSHRHSSQAFYIWDLVQVNSSIYKSQFYLVALHK